MDKTAMKFSHVKPVDFGTVDVEGPFDPPGPTPWK